MNLITINELSERIKMSVGALRKKIFLGEIPHYRLGNGRIIRFDMNDIDSWLKSRKVDANIKPWKQLRIKKR